MAHVLLPGQNGGLWVHRTGAPGRFERPEKPFNRVAFSAAHVVADALADHDPAIDVRLDWERTIAYRRHLWSLMEIARANLLEELRTADVERIRLGRPRHSVSALVGDSPYTSSFARFLPEAIERWLREEVAPTYDAMKADPARAVSSASVFSDIRARHAQRQKDPESLRWREFGYARLPKMSSPEQKPAVTLECGNANMAAGINVHRLFR